MRADLTPHCMSFLVICRRLLPRIDPAAAGAARVRGQDQYGVYRKPAESGHQTAVVIICTAALSAVFKWKTTRFVAKSLSDRVGGILTGASAVVFGLSIGVCVSEIIWVCLDAGTAQPREICRLLATSVQRLLLTAIAVWMTVFIGNFPILLHGKEI